jgi:hypothetical protein
MNLLNKGLDLPTVASEVLDFGRKKTFEQSEGILLSCFLKVRLRQMDWEFIM